MSLHLSSSRSSALFKMALVIPMIWLMAGCASYPPNAELERIDLQNGYRFDTLAETDNTESLFVILTFSGGGTRAAALSYGVMEKLKSTPIVWKGRKKTLLDEVDVISSVSGGSFTAAYYGLFRERLFAQENGFEDVFLYKDIEADLKALLFNPANLGRLMSPTFGRIDLASEFYGKEIFEDKTFEDLKAKGRPFIMINATDMTKGAPFTFTQSQFDLLCSDLGPFPIARAVAASSDFPVAFTPLQINNYASKCVYDKPTWMKLADKDRDFAINPSRNNRARILWSYRNAEKRPYVHLLDGGVADNIGFRGPLTALTSNDSPWSILNKVNNGKIEKLVVIIVDAKTRAEQSFDKSPSPPSVLTVLETISTVPLDNYSFDTVLQLKRTFQEWRKARTHLWGDGGRHNAFAYCPPPPKDLDPRGLKPLDLYAVYVGFDQIGDGEKVMDETREWYLNLPTSFALSAETVDKLRGAGKVILEQSAPYSSLAKCLHG